MKSGRSILALPVLAALLVAGAVRADSPPNVWDVARDPAVGERYRIHQAVQVWLRPAGLGVFERDRLAGAERARAVLEAANAAESPDPVLRFDLGLVYEELQRHGRAAEVLGKALRMAPDAPGSDRAWWTYAIALAHLDRSPEEQAAYREYLARETDPHGRAIATLNLAESDMRLGELDSAVETYRDAFQQAVSLGNRDPQTEVLALWGLAVALDRSGDPSGGAAKAEQAVRADTSHVIQDTRTVFFVPGYERLWYLAMGATERAKMLPSDPVPAGTPDHRLVQAAQEWRRAEELWREYVKEAVPGDRWVRLAKSHLETTHERRLAADKKAGVRVTPKALPDPEL